MTSAALAPIGVYYPWPADMPPPSRAEIEAMVEGLIEYLDRQDGDPDFEPTLGSLDGTAHYNEMPQARWAEGGTQDREHEDEREEDNRALPKPPKWSGRGVDEMFIGRRAA